MSNDFYVSETASQMKGGHDFTFVMHNVGARGGSCGFLLPEAFHVDALNVLYEPDTDCIDSIEMKAARSPLLKSVVLPYALGAEAQRRTFKVRANPYTSSFGELNPAYKEFYEFADGFDFVLEEATLVVKTMEMEIQTIDYLTGSDGSVPPPDFLLVDTEGGDLDVLIGARQSLRNGGLAVIAEAQFHPIWRDQNLFDKMWKFMTDVGFEIVSFHMHPGLSPHRSPAGFRGAGFQTACDVLFLRDIDSLAEALPDPEECWIQMRKLAFLSLMLGQVEYGMKALAYAEGIPITDSLKYLAKKISYNEFLDKIDGMSKENTLHYPALFRVDISVQNQPVQPPRSEAISKGLKGRLKSILLRQPTCIITIIRKLRSPYVNLRMAMPRFRRWYVRKFVLSRRYNPFERLLLDAELDDVADIVYTRRLAEEPFVKKRKAHTSN